jgi:phage terminase small subunit
MAREISSQIEEVIEDFQNKTIPEIEVIYYREAFELLKESEAFDEALDYAKEMYDISPNLNTQVLGSLLALKIAEEKDIPKLLNEIDKLIENIKEEIEEEQQEEQQIELEQNEKEKQELNQSQSQSVKRKRKL